jgi:hypothetical protein
VSLQTVRPIGQDETVIENDAYYGGDVLKTIMDAEATVSLQVVGPGALTHLAGILGLLGRQSFRDALVGTDYSLLRRGAAQDVSVPNLTGMEERANADLDQAAAQPRFEDPREGRGMAARIAFEISIYIRMRINMQNVERSITRRQRRNDGVCHRMITAQQQRDSICVHGFGHRLENQGVIGGAVNVR